eukprot:SAG31_NODE_4098_length_3588_cov_2.607624_5_plen_81_part_00
MYDVVYCPIHLSASYLNLVQLFPSCSRQLYSSTICCTCACQLIGELELNNAPLSDLKLSRPRHGAHTEYPEAEPPDLLRR